MKLLIATHNENKVKEIKEIVNNKKIEVISLKDLKDQDDVIEDGTTFLENANIKAEYYYKKYGLITLADDSGLSVKSLDYRPGIHTARYNEGKNISNNRLLLKEMKNKNNRKAFFTCALVIIVDESKKIEVEERMYGYIYNKEKGRNGFGYDPIFYLKEYNKTAAEISISIKNKISHRGKALRKGLGELNEIINN